MAQNLLSPGIKVTETDLSLVVENVSATNAGFAGYFHKGYAEYPVRVSNVSDLIEKFGKPTNENFNDWYQAYFYLQYANSLYVSRAVDINGSFFKTENTVREVNETGKVEIDGNPDEIFVGSVVKFGENETPYKIIDIELPNAGATHELYLDVLSAEVGLYKVKINGSTYEYDCQQETVDKGNLTATRQIAQELSALIDQPGVVNDIVKSNSVVLTGTQVGIPIEFEVISGDIEFRTTREAAPVETYELVFDEETDFSLLALQGAPIYVQKKSVNAFKFVPRDLTQEEIEKDKDDKARTEIKIPDSTYQVRFNELYSNQNIFDVYYDSILFPDRRWEGFDDPCVLKFIARGFGEYGNNIKIAIARESDFKKPDTTVFENIYLKGLFEFTPLESNKEVAVIVFDENDVIQERYIVSLDPTAKDYQGRSIFIDTVINNKSSIVYCKTGQEGVMPRSCLSGNIIKLSNGENGTIGKSEIEMAYGSVDSSTIFGDIEGLALDIIIANEISPTSATKIATQREDCLGVVGADFNIVGQKSDKIVEMLIDKVKLGELSTGDSRNSYNAFYGNYAQIYDSFNDKYRWVNVAGMVAGRIAKSNTDLYPWYAAAGETQGNLTGVVKWAFSPNNKARDDMYINQINSIVRFPGRGDCIYGQKTLQSTNTAFNRINVRQLFNYIKRNIGDSLKSFVFELNDEFTRNRIDSLCSQFMGRVESLRGVYEYAVVCNETNNTSQVIDNNALVVDIAIKPTRIAEFIYLNLYALGSNVSISEVFNQS